MKKIISLIIILTTFNQFSIAAECKRPIKRIFTGYTASTSKIHVEHGDGYRASVVRLSAVNNDEKIVDRILSVLLSAHMGGKEVTFRYLKGVDNSEASCTASVSQLTEAVWLE